MPRRSLYQLTLTPQRAGCPLRLARGLTGQALRAMGARRWGVEPHCVAYLDGRYTFRATSAELQRALLALRSLAQSRGCYASPARLQPLDDSQPV